MKIYTKSGDKGETALLSGSRVSKAHLRLHAYGTTDELNSYIGLIRSFEEAKVKDTILEGVQNQLFVLGSHLANGGPKAFEGLPNIKSVWITALETDMDEMDLTLPKLKNFILPGGNQLLSFVHVARCVCRRAEREVVALNEFESTDPVIVQYLNRLSDWLFVFARYVGHLNRLQEVVWKP